MVQAGTTTSTRVRGENQSFNKIVIDGESIEVTLVGWQDTDFADGDPALFFRKDGRWVLQAEDGIKRVPTAPKEPAASTS